MTKLKSLGFAAGIVLLIAAVSCLYFSVRNLMELPPASAYEDMGVHTFVPVEVSPIQVENHATGRAGRTHPTQTVYVVSYQADDNSGYQYRYESSVESTAQRILEEGTPVERRVLSIPEENTYLTVEIDETAESYTSGQSSIYCLLLGVASLYLVVCLAVTVRLRLKKRTSHT